MTNKAVYNDPENKYLKIFSKMSCWLFYLLVSFFADIYPPWNARRFSSAR